jgi:Tol biopolymer transport system component
VEAENNLFEYYLDNNNNLQITERPLSDEWHYQATYEQVESPLPIIYSNDFETGGLGFLESQLIPGTDTAEWELLEDTDGNTVVAPTHADDGRARLDCRFSLDQDFTVEYRLKLLPSQTVDGSCHSEYLLGFTQDNISYNNLSFYFVISEARLDVDIQPEGEDEIHESIPINIMYESWHTVKIICRDGRELQFILDELPVYSFELDTTYRVRDSQFIGSPNTDEWYLDDLTVSTPVVEEFITPDYSNHEILYVHAGTIMYTRPDGTGTVNIVDSPYSCWGAKFIPGTDQIVYVSKVDGNEDLYMYDISEGATVRLTTNVNSDNMLSPTPDGSTIIFCSDRNGTGSRDWDLYSLNLADSSVTRLTTTTDARELSPVVSPDGTLIACTNEIIDVESGDDLFVMNIDGTNPVNVIDDSFDLVTYSARWSPDGSEIIFHARDVAGIWNGCKIYTVSADTSTAPNTPTMLLDPMSISSAPQAVAISPDYSPDGTQIAFSLRERKADESERQALFIADADGTNPQRITEWITEGWLFHTVWQ